MKKKLRCPFCGSFPCIKENKVAYGTMYRICCSNTKCIFRPSADDVDEERLIDTWNTRFTAMHAHI